MSFAHNIQEAICLTAEQISAKELSGKYLFCVKITSHIKEASDNNNHRADKSSALQKELNSLSKEYEKKKLRSITMNNKRLVPEAKEAMDKFKMEAASDEDVTDTY